jgi:hypothetical protein
MRDASLRLSADLRRSAVHLRNLALGRSQFLTVSALKIFDVQDFQVLKMLKMLTMLASRGNSPLVRSGPPRRMQA